MASAGSLAIANCAKYATGLFDPVIIALVLVVALTQDASKKRAARLAAVTGGYLVILLVTLLAIATIGNGYYTTGIEATTTNRASDGQNSLWILSTIWPFLKAIVPLTLLGVIVCLFLERDIYRRLLALLLAGTGTLAPLNQIRIHTSTSLTKHEDFAAWFMALVAGYAVSSLMRGPLLARIGVACSGLAALGVTLIIGLPYASYADSYWPNTNYVINVVRPMVEHTKGELLFQNPSILEYYMNGTKGWGSLWKRISGEGSLRLPSGRTIDDAPVGSDGIPGPFIAAMHRGYFKIIVLNKNWGNSFDAQMIPAVRADSDYRVVAQNSQFAVWKYMALTK
jgi:hypothetical protein